MGPHASVSPAQLVFTPGNWNTAQSVVVSAVDDALAEGAHVETITHAAASSDGNYNGIGVASVTVNVTDNDSAGVVGDADHGQRDRRAAAAAATVWAHDAAHG